jgi:hypothetical protein
MTQSGVEPATFRLVAQCLNQLRHQQRASFLLINSKVAAHFLSYLAEYFISQHKIRCFKYLYIFILK